ncbi:MAG: CHASE domain-containing protein [Bacteroidota bacterium]
MVLTVLATLYTKYNEESDACREFRLICSDLKTKIVTRLYAHAGLLRSGSALFSVSDTVTQSIWKEFCERSKIERNLPGIQGFGFSMIIPANQLQKHIIAVRKQGFRDYAIKPAGNRSTYTTIIYLEPFSGRNLQAFGYDMFSEPRRRRAMELSRDSDMVTLSDKVTLVQETEKDVQAGVLMYVPVYRNQMPANNFLQRRAAIRGWVYMPCRMNDLMTGILGRWDLTRSGRIQLQVYDGYESANSLLYDSQKNDTSARKDVSGRNFRIPVEFNGKRWMLHFVQSGNSSPYFQGKVVLVFLGGLLISLLVYLLALALANTTVRAGILAGRLLSEIEEGEIRFKKMFAHHSSIMLLINPETGAIMDANPAAAGFYGYSVETLCSMAIDEINRLPHGQLAIELKKALNQSHNNFIFRHRLASGEERMVEVYSSPIIHEEKTILFSIIHDITERLIAEEAIVRSEEALRISEDRLRLAANAGNIGIWDWDVAQNKLAWDKSMYSLYGITEEDFGGVFETWVKTVHPEDRGFAQREIMAAIKGERKSEIEFRIVRPDGDLRIIRSSSQIIRDKDGKALRMIGTNIDITGLKMAELKIEEKNRELVKAVAEKDKFFSIIAHDLRSPFNALLGLTRLLAEELPTFTMDEIMKISVSLKNSANNLFSLLENLLQWSKMQRGIITFNPVSCSLLNSVSAIIALSRETADKKLITITCSVGDDLRVMADPNMLESLLRNLVFNAVKFTGRGGKITIMAKRFDGNSVDVSVTDTGIGMNSQMIANLFRIEEKTSRQGTEGEPSSGLGLIICKDYVEKHGGKIWVESEEGRGSSFHFTIPALPEVFSL